MGQLLFAAQLHLGQLATLTKTTPLAESHGKVMQLLKTAIKQTHSLSHQLTPTILTDFGLAVAVRGICSDFTTPQLRLHCAATELGPVPPLALAVYRMAQELASNIVQHARATEAHVRLTGDEDWLELRAEDDGCGFGPAPARWHGPARAAQPRATAERPTDHCVLGRVWHPN